MDKKKKNQVKKMDELQVRKFWVMVLIILVSGLICFGFVYVWLIMDSAKQEETLPAISQLNIALENSADASLTLIDTFPKTIDGGMSTVAYKFKLTNAGEANSKYVVSLVPDEEAANECKISHNGEECILIPTSSIRYSIVRNSWTHETAILGDDQNNIDMGIIEPGDENAISYELKIWVDYDTNFDTTNAFFFGKLEVETK